VVDIDGTMVDNDHKVRELSDRFGKGPNHWDEKMCDEFFSEWFYPFAGALLLPQTAKRMGAEFVFLTGRSECYRGQTEQMLDNDFKLDCDRTPLFMRSDGDRRPSHVAKTELAERTVVPIYRDSVLVFLDDDEACLGEYNKYGVALKAPRCWDALAFWTD